MSTDFRLFDVCTQYINCYLASSVEELASRVYSAKIAYPDTDCCCEKIARMERILEILISDHSICAFT